MPAYGTPTTLQNAATATGNGAVLNVRGWPTVGVQVVISATATVIFEGTIDASNWVSLSAVPAAGGSVVSSVTASGLWVIPSSGVNQLRARISSYGSGTVTVSALPTLAGLPPDAPSGGTVVDTELPAAAALGDTAANPTAPAVGAFTMVWDAVGNQWQRAAAANQGDTNTAGNIIGTYPFVWFGASGQKMRSPNIFKPLSAVNTNAEITIWTPTSGKKFRLMGYHLTSSVAGNVTLKDNTSGTTIAIVPSGAGGSGVFVSLGNGILSAAANNVLTATGPTASATSGIVFGTEE